MKKLLEWMRDELLFVLAAVLYIWAFAAAPDRALQALSVGWRTFLGILPIITAVFAALGLFNVWVDKKKIAETLGKGGGIKAVAIASLAGTILVGPVYVIFPLLKAVREHGARWAVIGAVLAAWAVKVPMVPMEIGMLGLRFSVARIVLVALAAIPIGYLLEWVMSFGRGGDPKPSSEGTVVGE